MKRLFSGLLVVALIGLGIFTTGCGRMIDPAPAPDTTAPTVTLTVPANLATGVFINRSILATFSKLMDPATLNSPATTFTLLQGITPVPGTVSYVGYVATFKPLINLAASTTYSAVITTAAKDLAGNALAVNKVWTFTTGTSVDTTPPTVTLTDPLNLATGVPINQAIAATFSKPMNPLTINTPATTFTLKVQGGAAVAGTVTSIGQITTFTPTANLAVSTTYEATISTVAEDLAGNALAVDKVWTFTTGSSTDTTRPTVTSTAPVDLATNEALGVNVTATFSKAMNPASLTNLTFTLKKQGGAVVAGTVSYEGFMATFNPDSNLALSTTYEATITTGAKDLANNGLAVNKVWTFKTRGLAPGAVPLGLADTYGIAAYSAITAAGPSTIEGDAAILINPATSFTGFPPAVLTGTGHFADAVAVSVYAALLDAYNFGWAQATTKPALTPGADQGLLSPCAPGVYESPSTLIINTPLTLDGGGNPDAVWIFKVGSDMTTVAGAPGGNVLLTNGAQAKNVFFVVVGNATIGGGTTFNGNVLAGATVAFPGTTIPTVINGRMLGGALGAGSLTLDNIVGVTVNVPLP
jgi:hypothetical protein